jgi:hypothetical protein
MCAERPTRDELDVLRVHPLHEEGVGADRDEPIPRPRGPPAAVSTMMWLWVPCRFR